jgi:CRISPR associated protein Cas1
LTVEGERRRFAISSELRAGTPKQASCPINAVLNYAYIVEAGRAAEALAAQGLALPISYLHSDKKGRNSLGRGQAAPPGDRRQGLCLRVA